MRIKAHKLKKQTNSEVKSYGPRNSKIHLCVADVQDIFNNRDYFIPLLSIFCWGIQGQWQEQ